VTTRGRLDCTLTQATHVPMLCGLIEYVLLGYVPLRWVNCSVSSNFSWIYSWFLGVNLRERGEEGG